jgi:serine O-acetyltransferase
LQNVTLGGSGIAHGRRHPTLRTGVMVGAGARILGAVEIGAYSKVAAGSVVTTDVPAHSTAVGVPARIIVGSAPGNPAAEMDQMLTDRDYAASSYVI